VILRCLTLAATIATLALLGGCRSSRNSPAAAVQALAEAERDGNAAEVLRLLGPATRAPPGVRRQAAPPSWRGGRRTLAPADSDRRGLDAAALPDRRRARAQPDDGPAVVEVMGRHGEREQVTAVRDAEGWKVELP